jgi:hypothetical protein
MAVRVNTAKIAMMEKHIPSFGDIIKLLSWVHFLLKIQLKKT